MTDETPENISIVVRNLDTEIDLSFNQSVELLKVS